MILTEETILQSLTDMNEDSKGLSEFFNKVQESDLMKQILDSQTVLDRLNKVIECLENSQSIKYEPTASLILSYLFDIRDNQVPTWVMDSSTTKHGGSNND